jgi:hypothetical protein
MPEENHKLDNMWAWQVDMDGAVVIQYAVTRPRATALVPPARGQRQRNCATRDLNLSRCGVVVNHGDESIAPG